MEHLRLKQIRQMILETCQQCGRNPDAITLIGASKAQNIERIQELVEQGLEDLGENYVQELLQKQTALAALGSRLRWHFIGRLQRRKIRQIIDKVTCIHSLDRLELAQEIDRRAAEQGLQCRALIQVNVGEEASKGGLLPNEVIPFIEACYDLAHLDLVGLMTLPPFHEEAENSRPYLRQLRELRDAINKAAVYKQPLRELSMGMSHDYRIAIEEGATMIRLGTLLFGPR